MHRPLRIALVVNPFRFKNRVPQHAPELARELLGCGHVVRGFGATPGAIPRSGELGTSGQGEPVVSIDRFVPDVLVAYDALSPAAARAARCASKLNVPLFLVEEALPDRGRRLKRVVRWLGERLWGSYVRRRASRVIALDAAARAQAEEEGFDPERIHVLPGGVDLGHYRPNLTSPLPTQHGIRGRILLHLGRIDHDRGLEVLVEAFAHTVGRREGWTLVLAGTGPAAHHLRAQASRLGIGARLCWLRTPREEELPGLLAASTLLVCPSLAEDVSGWRVRRALACGLPVLAGRGSRSEEFVEHDGCGLLIDEQDVAAWEEALTIATGSPERRRRWGLAARERAEERYAWPTIAKYFEALMLGELRQTGPDQEPTDPAIRPIT
ncbi:MAG TPA: glycosyltransferase [Planctomycetes bacterium]|nr:glycosyltransferase [Planctomycetota bacterium]HIK59488.1 glycosyltransferase [Planctomycetota bacterium]